MAGGLYHSLALRSDGTMRAWGYNGFGQLGDGTTTQRLTPVVVTGITDVTAIAASQYHSLAIRSDTTAWAWGQNSYGQLGDGTTTSRKNPTQVPGLTEIVSIEGGNQHTLMAQRVRTSLYVPDRSGIITEKVILRGYLRRLSDSAWLPGRTITFKIDGSVVGTSVTDANGHAPLEWVITDGPTTRTIAGEFAGDGEYQPSSGSATLTALTSGTKMEAYDRTGRITQYTDFKCVLFRSDNSPLPNKTIRFSLDGTLLGTDVTRPNGEAKIGHVIAAGNGAGTRSILYEFAGDAGYAAISRTRTLTVQKALPYIWVLSRSCMLGHKVALYAYFRRLYDYQKQADKTVDFRIDGTLVHTMQTNNDGVAYYIYQTVQPRGTYTIRCEFAGDAWVEAGHGEATLTIY